MTPVKAAARAPDQAEDASLLPLLAKARAVAAKVGRQKAELAGANRAAHQAQVREALTRTELTLGLQEALIARTDALARVREQALQAYVGRRSPEVIERPPASGPFDGLLRRLGKPGLARVLARRGLWRGARSWRDIGPIVAYLRRGPDASAAPEAPFDQAWYLAANPDVAGSGLSPLAHYFLVGGPQGRAHSPLFDDAYYRREHSLGPDETTLEHYARRGAAEGLSPHPLFDVAHYLGQSPSLRPHEAPLSHYLREGAKQGLAPHPLFDPAWYAGQAPDAPPGGGLQHYLAAGWREGRSPHPLFDPSWYLAQYPDVAEAGLEPLTHYLAAGAAELRSPGPWLDAPAYVAARGEALAPGANPLLDYLRAGAWTLAEVRPGFPTAAYLAARPGLVRTGMTPLEHWARQGRP